MQISARCISSRQIEWRKSISYSLTAACWNRGIECVFIYKYIGARASEIMDGGRSIIPSSARGKYPSSKYAHTRRFAYLSLSSLLSQPPTASHARRSISLALTRRESSAANLLLISLSIYRLWYRRHHALKQQAPCRHALIDSSTTTKLLFQHINWERVTKAVKKEQILFIKSLSK